MQMHGRDALRPVPTGRGAVHVQHQEEARASQGRDSRGATAARRWVGVLEEKDERQPFFVGGIFDIGAGASFILQYKGDRPRGPRRVEVPGLLSGALHADVSENLYLWQHLALSVVFPSCCFVPFLVCVLCLCLPVTRRSNAELEHIRSVFLILVMVRAFLVGLLFVRHYKMFMSRTMPFSGAFSGLLGTVSLD